jgi:dUTPase
MITLNKTVVMNEEQDNEKIHKNDNIMQLVFWWICLISVLLFELIVF